MSKVTKVRVSVPVNVCVTVDRLPGEDDEAVTKKAIELVERIVGGDGCDLNRYNDEAFSSKARIRSNGVCYALINSSIEDELGL